MKYNLTPFEKIFNKTVSSYKTWNENLEYFFYNEDFNASLRDEYYDILVNNAWMIPELIVNGVLIDEYSGLFTLDTPSTKSVHTFNLANFIRRNYISFDKKRIRTICTDYGILNIQLRLCGLDLVSTIFRDGNIPGAVLTCIGNKCPPYTLSSDGDADLIFAANMFEGEQMAFTNWNYLIDHRTEGKEVYFTSNSFIDLQKFIRYDRIQMMEKPQEIYDDESYSNLDLGLSNRIYKLI